MPPNSAVTGVDGIGDEPVTIVVVVQFPGAVTVPVIVAVAVPVSDGIVQTDPVTVPVVVVTLVVVRHGAAVRPSMVMLPCGHAVVAVIVMTASPPNSKAVDEALRLIAPSRGRHCGPTLPVGSVPLSASEMVVRSVPSASAT